MCDAGSVLCDVTQVMCVCYVMQVIGITVLPGCCLKRIHRINKDLIQRPLQGGRCRRGMCSLPTGSCGNQNFTIF